jgi:exodeoxyribonuclease-1
MNFVFYDTETTGTDTTFGQILQFAAILTDADLNELERFETRCRLLPYVVPAPGALLTTRVTTAMLTDSNLPSHYEMMRSPKTGSRGLLQRTLQTKPWLQSKPLNFNPL